MGTGWVSRQRRRPTSPRPGERERRRCPQEGTREDERPASSRQASPPGRPPPGTCSLWMQGPAGVPIAHGCIPAGGACLRWRQGFLCTHPGECLPPGGTSRRSLVGGFVRGAHPRGRWGPPLFHGVTMPDRHPFVPSTGGIPSGGAVAFGDMRKQGLPGVLCLPPCTSVEGPAASMGHASRWSTLVLSCTTDVAPAAQAWTRSGQRIPVTHLHPSHTHSLLHHEPRSPPPRTTSRHAPRSTTSTLRNAPQPHPPTQRTPSPVSTGFPVPTVSKEHTEPSDPNGDTPHPDATHDTYTTPETNTQNTGSTRTTRTPHTQRNHPTHPTKGAPNSTPHQVHTPHQPSHAQALPTHPHRATSPTGTLHENATTANPSTPQSLRDQPTQPQALDHAGTQPRTSPPTGPQVQHPLPISLHPERTHRYRRYPKHPTAGPEGQATPGPKPDRVGTGDTVTPETSPRIEITTFTYRCSAYEVAPSQGVAPPDERTSPVRTKYLCHQASPPDHYLRLSPQPGHTHQRLLLPTDQSTAGVREGF